MGRDRVNYRKLSNQKPNVLPAGWIFPKLNLIFLHPVTGLCYNLSENALLPIRPAVDRRAWTPFTLMVPDGVEAGGGKNKEVIPLWQSFP